MANVIKATIVYWRHNGGFWVETPILTFQPMERQRQWRHPITKVEDSRSLRRARVVNQGEAKRSAHEIKTLSRAAALRNSDVERERAVLERVLEKVRTSTGYLNEDMHNQRT